MHAIVRLGLSCEWELSALVPTPAAASADGRSATWEVEVQPGGSVVVGAGDASSSGREWAYLFWEARTVAGAHVAALHGAAGGSGGMAPPLPLALDLALPQPAKGLASPPWRPPVAGLPLPDFEPAHSFVVPRAGAQEWLHGALVGGFGMPVREATDMITYWCGGAGFRVWGRLLQVFGGLSVGPAFACCVRSKRPYTGLPPTLSYPSQHPSPIPPRLPLLHA